MHRWFWTLPLLSISFVSPALAVDALFEQTFPAPIDALSIELHDPTATYEVRGFDGTQWLPAQELHIEDEQDPTLRESNLVMFAKPISRIRINTADHVSVHPIAVSRAPVSYLVAATARTETPRILSRDAWGADESLRVKKKADKPPVADPSDNGDAPEPTNRELECEDAQKKYPNEFKLGTKKVTKNDQGQDLRWPLTYSKDIKLLVVHHTAIATGGDERSGAERMRALYSYHTVNRGWGDIGYHYVIDEDGKIYEGRTGGDLVVAGHAYCNNTGTIGVALMGNFDAEKPTQTQMRNLQWLLKQLAEKYKIDLEEEVTFHGKSLPPIVRHRDLLSTDCPGYYVASVIDQVRDNVAGGYLTAAISFPKPPPSKASTTLTKREERLEARIKKNPSRRLATLTRKIRRYDRLGNSRTAGTRLKLAASVVPRPPTPVRKAVAATASQGKLIRIRLGFEGDTAEIQTSSPTLVNGKATTGNSYTFERAGEECALGSTVAKAIRIDPGRGVSTVASWNKKANRFRGILECQIVDGKLILINELPLEDYLTGLAEEPDTEPFEKQRAFAIAARTYAAYYADPAHRKFPGMPYDGDDSPARFQAYGGIVFEEQNKKWVEAVTATAGKVLTKDDQIIRPPYFSSSNGRTRSPAEVGWKNFPFAEIFESKLDPWCEGMQQSGHGVGMSGCGAEAQANEGKKAEDILKYYYPGTTLKAP